VLLLSVTAEYTCSDGAVVPLSSRCNGYVQCSDAADEHNCCELLCCCCCCCFLLSVQSELDFIAEHRAELEFGILYKMLDSLEITVL